MHPAGQRPRQPSGQPQRAGLTAKPPDLAVAQGFVSLTSLRTAPRISDALFFGLFFLGLWRWIDVGLIYHGAGEVKAFPVFFWGEEFFRRYLALPGGSVDYASALLAQTLCHSWLGALLLTLQAGVIFTAARSTLRVVGFGGWSELAYLLPLLLAGLYADYRHGSAAVTTCALSVILIWAFVRFRPRRLYPWAGLLLVSSAALYVIAPNGLLPFALTVAAAEAIQTRSILRTFLPLLFAALVCPSLACLVYGLGPAEICSSVMPFEWRTGSADTRGVWLLAGLFCVLPALVGSRLLLDQLAPAGSPLGRVPESSRLAISRLSCLAQATLAPLALGIVLFIGVDTRLKSVLATDYWAWHREWRKVQGAAGANGGHPLVASAIAQAAFHLGGLPDTLPSLRSPSELLLAEPSQRYHWRRGDLCYDLGYVNMALHHLIESVEFWGERPQLLRRLAMVNLALTNLPTAQVYLRALLRVPFHSAWAQQRLSAIEADPDLRQDAEVVRLRTLMPRSDSVVRQTVDETLLMLLTANRHNRMAFEYLITYRLLARDLTGFANDLARLADFPDLRPTTLWEEGVVMASHVVGRHPSLDGRELDQAARLRLKTMVEALQSSRGDRAAARSKLPTDYAQSYFYYYLFQP